MTRYQHKDKITLDITPPEPGRIVNILVATCQCSVCGGMVGRVHDGEGLTNWLKEQGWVKRAIDDEGGPVWVCPVCKAK